MRYDLSSFREFQSRPLAVRAAPLSPQFSRQSSTRSLGAFASRSRVPWRSGFETFLRQLPQSLGTAIEYGLCLP